MSYPEVRLSENGRLIVLEDYTLCYDEATELIERMINLLPNMDLAPIEFGRTSKRSKKKKV